MRRRLLNLLTALSLLLCVAAVTLRVGNRDRIFGLNYDAPDRSHGVSVRPIGFVLDAARFDDPLSSQPVPRLAVDEREIQHGQAVAASPPTRLLRGRV